MSPITPKIQPSANEAVLADLSRDLLKVAARIQGEIQQVSFAEIKPESLSQVEAAEQAVDTLASDLSRGEGEITAWHRVLTDYESAWFKVITSLGERRN